MGLEVCCTLGMLTDSQAERLAEAGLFAYNHNLDTSPEYYDYNWTVRSDIETKFGDGFTEKITQALLDLNPSDHAEILELFNADQFITTNNSNYDAIKDTAEALGIIK